MTKCFISVTNEQDKFPISEENSENISCNMLKYLTTRSDIIDKSCLSQYDLSTLDLYLDILICNDEKIQELNRDYRGKDKATDVLSFALFADNIENRIIMDNQIFLGEIIISAETAQKQTEEKTFEEEINFLLSHGILHLLGFDHKDEETLDYMLKIQNEMILNKDVE